MIELTIILNMNSRLVSTITFNEYYILYIIFIILY